MAHNNAVPKEITPLTTAISRVATNLIYGDQALADTLQAGLSTIRTWRLRRIIPYIKTGHKSVIYDLKKVLAALEMLEVKPVTGKGAR
jgi:hypothetical protein